MSTMGNSRAREAIEQQAADYLVALMCDPTVELKQQASGWIERDPAHAVAFARAEQVWELAGQVTLTPPVETVDPRDAQPDFFRSEHSRRRVVAMGALAASLVGLVGVGLLRRRQDISTAVGEVRDVVLPDGSTMHLNTDSRVIIAMTDKRRLVRLLQGEAYFSVVHNKDAPFDVEASGAVVRALGTAFNVRVREALVELTVTQGLVGVRTAKGMTERVPAGEAAFVQARTVALTSLHKDELEQRTAWRSKMIELNGESLAQAVEEFNRYRETPIVIGDQRIAPLRVGGRFQVDQVDQFLLALEQTLPVSILTQQDGGVLLLYRSRDMSADPGDTGGGQDDAAFANPQSGS